MSFNRFRVYDLVQRSLSTVLFVTTCAGGVFIGVNVYNNHKEKQKMQKELAYKQMRRDDPEKKV
ncbi:hypothetical protein GGI04_002082 [Coemansia thaxteri]|uniref:Uncharacterized protein n=1 Tax=Coemansia thaxteri TaxID=2663907 RepID=A0A9W8BI41_9FUNG|nr:hypothetical protein H4R26_003926 [Coemansia thaxteri]KAJ2005864.1 hypothetical protein GGI04_002082 [Coemansia thaxteri]KAJ2473647.1 hypothetical protein GGI02_000705 [Coemansia sp. RSA 2322]